jgi:hypothetical protein
MVSRIGGGGHKSAIKRRLFLQKLVAAHEAGELQFFNRLLPWSTRKPSPPSWHHCAIVNGWSTASVHSAAPSPTASPSQIAA